MVLWPNIPWRRFLGAYRVGERWIVWYQHGGLAAHDQVIAVRPSLDRTASAGAYQIVTGSNLSGNLCEASKAALAGVTASDL